MLTHLRVQHIALITELELTFNQGFSVLTGETGAGKSIIIDAISLLLGAPASESLIQHGFEDAMVEGLFQLSQIPPELETFLSPEEPLIIYRKISRKKGSGIVRINNQTVTLKELKKMTENLLNIVGQHEHTQLFNPATQLCHLDASSPILQTLKTQYQNHYIQYKACESAYRLSRQQDSTLTQQADFLQFQFSDIQAQNFNAEEEDLLSEQKKLSKSHHKFKQIATTSSHILSTLQSQIGQLKKSIPTLTELDPSWITWQETYNQMESELAEQQNQLELKAHHLHQVSTFDIESIETRLDLIFKYKTKYKKNTLYELMEYQKNLDFQLKSLETSEANQETFKKELEESEVLLKKLGASLTQKRKEIAQELAQKIEHILSDLHVSHPQFYIQISPSNTPQDSGLDQIEFQLSANLGEPLKPLSQIASGGELSRIMLALKSVFFQSNPIPTLIFDEIDTGVGGLTANKIGEHLHHISKNCQVLCITHLPQIAHLANTHYTVQKNNIKNRTQIQVQPLLNADSVKAELSRMVGGYPVLSTLK